MSNPEFKRNLWLSFSLHRLIAMPALLALTFFASAFSTEPDRVASNLYSSSIVLFIFTVWLWGARNANAAIVDELRDKTWDQQRMSALLPWTMTWGKLFGATSFNWYGGLMCLLVIALSGIAAKKSDVLPTLLTLCSIGILLHAALIALNLHANQYQSRIIQRGGLGWLLIVLVLILAPTLATATAKQIHWWGLEIHHAHFWLFSAVMFSACAVFAAWRVTSNALQMPTLPWAWPAFACILATYLAGFISEGNRVNSLLLMGLVVSVCMSYVSLFSEPNTLLRWRKLQLLQHKQAWRSWFENLPLWPTTLLLAFLCALLFSLTSNIGKAGIKPADFPPSPDAVSLALMLLRDACILLFFAFLSTSKRAITATFLYLLVLDLLLPFLANIAGLNAVQFFFMPFDGVNNAWGGTLILCIHVAIAMGLVYWRLGKEKTNERYT